MTLEIRPLGMAGLVLCHLLVPRHLAMSSSSMLHDIFLHQAILACLDGYMNIAMEQTEEYVNGHLKNNSLC
nr:sm-like protein lsm36b [Quercus suber]